MSEFALWVQQNFWNVSLAHVFMNYLPIAVVGILFVGGASFACPGYVRIAYCVSNDMINRSMPAFKALAEEYGLNK